MQRYFTYQAGGDEYRIMTEYQGRRLKFVKLKTGSDGSLYVFMDQPATKRAVWTTLSSKVGYAVPKKIPFKISYHCTGQIDFHEVDAETTYWEPIYALSGPFPLTYLSVPSVAHLPPCNDARKTDLVVEWPAELPTRVTFALELAPASYWPEKVFARVPFFKLYTFSMRFAQFPIRVPDEFTSNYFLRTMPFCRSVEKPPRKQDAVAEFKRRAMEASSL
jgi:hypothetical protein